MKFQQHYFAFAEVVFSEKSFQPHHIALAPMVAHLQEVLSSPPHCFCSDGTTRPNNNPLFTSNQDKFWVTWPTTTHALLHVQTDTPVMNDPPMSPQGSRDDSVENRNNKDYL